MPKMKGDIMHTKNYVIVRPEIAAGAHRFVPISRQPIEDAHHFYFYDPERDHNRPKESRYTGDALQVLFGKRWLHVYGTDWDFITDEEAQRLMIEPGLNAAGRFFMGYHRTR